MIIGLIEIKFYSHEGFVRFSYVQFEKHFLSKENIIQDKPFFYKSELTLRNNFGKKDFQSLGQDFGYDFIIEITQTNGIKFREIL